MFWPLNRRRTRLRSSKHSGQKLEGVIQIVHEGVPEIRGVCLLISQIIIPATDACSSLFAEH